MKVSDIMKKNSFVEGAVIATFAVVITKILGMLYVIPFYDIIGPQGGALYSYAYNIYSIFLGISSAGIPTAISKIISEYNTLGMHEAKLRTFKIGRKLISIISIIAFLVMFIFAEWIGAAILGDISGGNTIADVAFVIRCISFAVLVIPYLSVARGYIQGHQIIAPSSISNVLEQVVRIFVILSGSFLAYKIFSSTLTLAVGIAVSGAFFGGLAAYIYIHYKIKTNKETLSIKEFDKQDNVSNKDIIKKIISYALPFIIINIANNIYSFTDMILVIRGLNFIGFSGPDIEFIQSAITTWANKICMIIGAFSIGMSASLVPNIVSSAVKKDWKGVNDKINRAYQIILIVAIPCAAGICILKTPVWNVFYAPSEYGSEVLFLMAICAVFSNIYSITFNTMQSLNKFKLVYISVISGFAFNALLDIPLMILFSRVGIPAYWGATAASISGFSLSVIIATWNLKFKHKLSFKSTFKMFLKIMIPTLSMIVVLLVLNMFIKIDVSTKFNAILVIIVNILVGAPVYLGIAYKMRLFHETFGEAYINKFIKKLTFFKKKSKQA